MLIKISHGSSSLSTSPIELYIAIQYTYSVISYAKHMSVFEGDVNKDIDIDDVDEDVVAYQKERETQRAESRNAPSEGFNSI